MKRIVTLIVALITAVLLTGCTGGNVLVKEQRNVVTMPPASLFDCPGLPPIPETYTQKDVADLLLKYYERGEICKRNLEAVKKYLETARDILEEAE
jgi:hypothetical protein